MDRKGASFCCGHRTTIRAGDEQVRARQPLCHIAFDSAQIFVHALLYKSVQNSGDGALVFPHPRPNLAGQADTGIFPKCLTDCVTRENFMLGVGVAVEKCHGKTGCPCGRGLLASSETSSLSSGLSSSPSRSKRSSTSMTKFLSINGTVRRSNKLSALGTLMRCNSRMSR